MIRRTFPELITNEIVGVQPMSGPVGLAFALRYAYQSDTLGSGIDGKGSSDLLGNAYVPIVVRPQVLGLRLVATPH